MSTTARRAARGAEKPLTETEQRILEKAFGFRSGSWVHNGGDRHTLKALRSLVRRGLLRFEMLGVHQCHQRTEAGDELCQRLAKEADLRKGKAPITLDGSSHFPGSKNVGKKRGTVKNTDKPIGQIALFLIHKLERLGWSPNDFADELEAAGLGKNHEAVRKWLNGSNAPRLTEMNKVAKVLGYGDWYELVAAVAKFHKRQK